MMLPILAIAIAAIIDQEDVDHGGRWAEPGVALSDDCEAALELLLLRACGNGSAGGPRCSLLQHGRAPWSEALLSRHPHVAVFVLMPPVDASAEGEGARDPVGRPATHPSQPHPSFPALADRLAALPNVRIEVEGSEAVIVRCQRLECSPVARPPCQQDAFRMSHPLGRRTRS